MCYEAVIVSAGGDEATFAKSLIISQERHNKLVLQAPVRMHLLLATTQRKVPTQFSGLSSKA
jgi:hypothetical protein